MRRHLPASAAGRGRISREALRPRSRRRDGVLAQALLQRPPGMLGLVLTAGGARGAYQAGVLKRIGEIPSLADGPSPFKIVAGASAGAINGAMLAAGGATFREATSAAARLWSELQVEQVFRTDILTL